MNSLDYQQIATFAALANITAQCARKCKVYNVRPSNPQENIELARCKEECPRELRNLIFKNTEEGHGKDKKK